MSSPMECSRPYSIVSGTGIPEILRWEQFRRAWDHLVGSVVCVVSFKLYLPDKDTKNCLSMHVYLFAEHSAKFVQSIVD